MPRLKKSGEELRCLSLKGSLSKRIEMSGFSDKELASLVGLSERRFAEKRRNPALLTYLEFSRLAIRLGLTHEEIIEATVGEK